MTRPRLIALTLSLGMAIAAPVLAQEAPPSAAPVLAQEAAPSVAPAAPAAPAVAAVAVTPAAAVKGAPVVVGAPEPGKARMVFFRPSSLLGIVYSFKIRENEAELGLINNAGFFITDVAPGKHLFDAHTTAKDGLDFEVEDGETYYIKINMAAGLIAYTPRMLPSDKAAFDAVSAKLHATTLN